MMLAGTVATVLHKIVSHLLQVKISSYDGYLMSFLVGAEPTGGLPASPLP